MFEDKECKGCIGSENYCSMPFKMALYECPCLNCLVKSSCGEHCRKYRVYLKTVEQLDDDSFKIVKVTGSGSTYLHKYYLVSLADIEKKLNTLKGNIKVE